MSDYTFYLDRDPFGRPYAIFRAHNVDGFKRGEVERAMPDGSWSGAEKDVQYLFNLWLKGDFDTEDDEISEAQAVAQIEKWRTMSNWPGRQVW